jgi:rifampicin phosphotransferase
MKLNQEYIKPYKSKLEEQSVGGKFYKQTLMAQAGLPIPSFFCLTKDVFLAAINPIRSDIKTYLSHIDWSSDKSIQETSKLIHQKISSLEFPEAFIKAVLLAYDQHFSSRDLVSVRSSMVSEKAEFSEDSAQHAFAGMSESFLYVKKESVFERIKDCFASGFSPQVLTYRHSQGIDLLNFSVAVGIQKMVFGEKSFVMFTCDPITLERKTLMVAGLGIGEGVVQERVETDHYFINQKTKIISKKVVKKERLLTFNSELGEGIKEILTPDELKNLPVLKEEEILALDQLGQKIEKLFGCPQDIEGCYENGLIFILQSRPIQFSEKSIIVWTSANVSESFPGTTTPLTFSFAQDFYRIIFTDCYRALGVPEKIIAQNFEHLDHMVGYLKGKIYYNLTSFYRLHSLSPLFPFFKKQWEEMMGFSGSFYIDQDKGHFQNFIKGIGRFTYTLYGLGLISWRYLTNQRDVNNFLGWWEETIKELRGKDFNHLSSFECMTLYRSLWEKVGTHWWITLLNDTHLPTAYHVTEFLLKKWGLNDSPSLMSNLLCGGDNFKSVEIMYNGIRLSEEVKTDPKLKDLFLTASPEHIFSLLRHDFPSFKESFDHHLHFFGDRGLQELKIEQKGLRDDPLQLIQIIKNYVGQDLTIHKIIAEEKSRRAVGEAELSSRLKFSPLKRLILKFQFWRLRGFIQNRENTRYCRSELFGFSKRIFSSIAQHFVKSNILIGADDIFFLTVDEIFGLIEGASATENLKVLIEQRRREFEENQKIELPMDITTNGALYLNTLAKDEFDSDPSALKGLGSSPGVVQGRARVVLDPQAINKLNEGDILIAKETDPGWLFLMLASKGMVVERGSMLSHTAITGRKFGIPTIVSVPGITDKIKDGQLIEIDGAKGTIRLIEET